MEGFEGRNKRERRNCLRPKGNPGERCLGFPVKTAPGYCFLEEPRKVVGAQREALQCQESTARKAQSYAWAPGLPKTALLLVGETSTEWAGLKT